MRRALAVAALAVAGCGTARAHPYSELTVPPHPRAAVLLIHGGAWLAAGRRYVAMTRPYAQRFTRHRIATLNVDYRPGFAAIADIDRSYLRLRGLVGKRTPICVWGDSAGGQLALMLALKQPSVACVISEAGPTDLPALANIPLVGATVAFRAHGGLAAWSPVTYGRRYRQRLLLAYATNDPQVPAAQGGELHARAPRSTLVLLRPGPVPFMHSSVEAADLDRLARLEPAFVLASARR